jgi:hypothetical protein
MSRAERSTFNLDLVANGWAAPFVIFPLIPGELDLRLLVKAAATARTDKKGIWANPDTLLAYEYRAMEKLHAITKKIVAGESVRGAAAFAWRERYCVDTRNRATPAAPAGSPRWAAVSESRPGRRCGQSDLLADPTPPRTRLRVPAAAKLGPSISFVATELPGPRGGKC